MFNNTTSLNETNKVTGDTDIQIGQVFYEEWVRSVIWRVIPPIWLLLGTVGNALSVVILRRPEIGQMSIKPYLLALAFADVLAIYSGLLSGWIRYQFGVDVSSYSHFSCSMGMYSIYVGGAVCTWILAIVSVERFVCVWLPHASRRIRHRHRVIVLAVMLVVALVINLHIFYGFRLVQRPSLVHVCWIDDEDYTAFMLYRWPVVMIVLTGIGPFVTILICSLGIVAKLLMSQYSRMIRVQPMNSEIPSTSRSRRDQVAETTLNGSDNKRVNSSDRIVTDISVSTQRNTTISVSTQRNTTNSHDINRQISRNTAETRSTTIVLLAVNVIFLICTGPFQIYMVGNPYWRNGASSETLAKLNLLSSSLFMFAYINNISNFILYYVSGPRFRRAFMAMIGRQSVDETITLHTNVQSTT